MNISSADTVPVRYKLPILRGMGHGNGAMGNWGWGNGEWALVMGYMNRAMGNWEWGDGIILIGQSKIIVLPFPASNVPIIIQCQQSKDCCYFLILF